jgi:hypothetical protein
MNEKYAKNSRKNAIVRVSTLDRWLSVTKNLPRHTSKTIPASDVSSSAG